MTKEIRLRLSIH